jgi:beta-N-acetylhexosaminidase
MTKKILALLVAIIGSLNLSAQKENWVDSVFQTLNEEEKIAQLLMVPIASDWEKSKLNDIERQVKKASPGALMFTRGTPKKQIALTNEFQSLSKTPLLISSFAPSGFGALLDSALLFPSPLAIGALASDSLVFEFGREIGRELRLLGVNMNFGPNGNIADDSGLIQPVETFGENPTHVAHRALTFFKGMESEGILGCAKYFPIQGITVSDFQKDQPLVRVFLDSAEVRPFKQLFNNKIAAVLPATRELPVFYASKSVAKKNKYSGQMMSSLFAGRAIKNELNFDGLVIVDARAFDNSNKKLKNGEAELFAFETGNDVIITDYPEASIRRIKRLLKKQKTYKEQLDNSVKKILAAKYDAGLSGTKKLSAENVIAKLNSLDARLLQQKLYRSAITVVRNNQNLIPVLSLENKKMMSVIVGDTSDFNPFHHFVSKYVDNTKVSIRKEEHLTRFNDALLKHDVIVIAFTQLASAEIVSMVVESLKNKRPEQQIIVADFGSEAFKSHADNFETIVAGYSDFPEMLRAIPQVIFGGIGSTGILPVRMGQATAGASIKTITLKRFQYTIPEDAGLSSRSTQDRIHRQ